MTPDTPPTPAIRSPISAPLLLTLIRGMGLTTGAQVLDVCCHDGGTAFLLADAIGARITGIDSEEPAIQSARAAARAQQLDAQVEFLCMDPRHLELPVDGYDLILALGGVATGFGHPSVLARLRVHLRPGGWLVASDPVYLDSPVPAPVQAWLGDLRDDDGVQLLGRGNSPSPIVRAVFEQGHLAIETEAGYRALLEALGYRPELSCLLPESAWADYFSHGELEPSIHEESDLETRRREAAAYYAYGGRGSLGYLLIVARRPTLEEEGEEWA